MAALLGFSRSLTKERCYHRVTNVFRSVFSDKVDCEACYGGEKKWDATLLKHGCRFYTSMVCISY